MSGTEIVRLASLRGPAKFKEHLLSLGLNIPCDDVLETGASSSLQQPIRCNGIHLGNRIAVQPMEGWDGTPDGNPSEKTERRWQRFGASGGKLIWGGEAVAVRHEGRANPNQLLAAPHTKAGLAQLRATLIAEHIRVTGSETGLMVGLQLTHSGRYCRPNVHNRPEPKIVYHHPILDQRLHLPADYPLLTDGDIRGIIEDYHRAARLSWELGFDFVDIKHCHGYLGHEFLSAHTRDGDYGGSFENRTRFLREIVEGIHSIAPGLKIGVRLSAFDVVPFRPDPGQSPKKTSRGVPETYDSLIPYHWGFGVDSGKPTEPDLTEAGQFLDLLESLDIRLVNLTAGSPYYNPHLQRPALFPPSDGYQPPHDPLIEVSRQIQTVHTLKQRFPRLIMVGTAYSYLQEFLPYVAQAVVRQHWADFVGLGRMVLSYPELLWHASMGRPIERKKICRTFSDCTTAPRNGLPSGCYPLDPYYKESESARTLTEIKLKQP